MEIDVTDTLMQLSATSGPEQSCNIFWPLFADLTVTGGTPPYSYHWYADDWITVITDSCDTCQDIFGIRMDNSWYPDCAHLKCFVEDAAGQTDTLYKEICPNYYPDVFYDVQYDAVCPGMPTGVHNFWSSIMKPSGPDVDVQLMGLDSGTYITTQPYGYGCTAQWITYIGYYFSECSDAYSSSIDTPLCGACNGVITFYSYINNPDIYEYFDGVYLADGTDVALNNLCPNTWYYFYFHVGDGFTGADFYVPDSFYISLPGCSPIFPGDANNDGISNNLDLLSIGIAFSDTGSVRTDTTITWNAKYVYNWTNFFADSTNHKHADCNGNGIVSINDTLAIVQNYDSIQRPILSSVNIPGDPALFFDLPDTLLPFTTYQVPVYLGDSIDVANNIYGIAFSLGYNSSFIMPASIRWISDSSWLGDNNADLIDLQHNYSSGKLDVGITRFDHINKNGFGRIGWLQFTTRTIITDQTVYINTANITAISNNEIHQPVNSTLDSALLLHGNCFNTAVSHANACNSWCGASVQLQLNNAMGTAHYDWSGSQFTTVNCTPILADESTLNFLSTGIYQCIISDSIGCSDTIAVALNSEVSTLFATAATQREGCNVCDGSINLNVSGGHPPYSFNWDTLAASIGSNSYLQQNLTLICISNQNFICTVTDSLGCAKQFNQTFTFNDCLPDVWNTSIISACTNQNNGSVSIAPDPSSFMNCHLYDGYFSSIPPGAVMDTSWFPNAYLDVIPPGNYTYLIISGNICDTDSVVITVPEIAVEVNTTMPACGFCNGAAIAFVGGDTVNDNNGYITWSNDTSGLNWVIDSSICQNEIIQYTINHNLCLMINGSFSFDTCQLIQSVHSSLSDQFSQIQIIPNPNNGSFIIQLPHKISSTTRIEIINVPGEMIYSDEIKTGESRKEISLQNISVGLYTCRIISDENVMQQVFVIR